MNEDLLAKLDSYHHKLTDDAAARIRALQSDNQAQAARIAELEKYCQHLPLCNFVRRLGLAPYNCTCGLDKALRAVEKEER